MKLEMKERMEQVTDPKKLADEMRRLYGLIRNDRISYTASDVERVLKPGADAIDTLIAERDDFREANRINAASVNRLRSALEGLERKLVKATEALTKLADKWERRECMTDAYQLAAHELHAALAAIKETTNG